MKRLLLFAMLAMVAMTMTTTISCDNGAIEDEPENSIDYGNARFVPNMVCSEMGVALRGGSQHLQYCEWNVIKWKYECEEDWHIISYPTWIFGNPSPSIYGLNYKGLNNGYGEMPYQIFQEVQDGKLTENFWLFHGYWTEDNSISSRFMWEILEHDYDFDNKCFKEGYITIRLYGFNYREDGKGKYREYEPCEKSLFKLQKNS